MKKILKILLLFIGIYFLLFIIGSIFGISIVPSLGAIIEGIKYLILSKSDNPFDHLVNLSK